MGRKAMGLAEGTISIVDKRAITYDRVWCCYEVAVSIGCDVSSSYKYDIYTACDCKDRRGKACKAVGITDGLAAVDKNTGNFKSKREDAFPLDIIDRALQVRLEHGKSTMESDRVHILNSIVGNPDLDADPVQAHQYYDAFERYLAAIATSPITKLQVSFSECPEFTGAMA